MRAGFAKVDITPRVGVELCGFGPFRLRKSIAVRDRLWARAMAVEQAGTTLVLVSCDLIGLSEELCATIREQVCERAKLAPEAVMLHCTHTHSGPAVAGYSGWGEPDWPYVEIVPGRIAEACIRAVEGLTEATMSHSEVPCEGIGLNREYEGPTPPLELTLDEGWRPAKPELTDTTCHVLASHSDGRLIGFASYFGCHPVVCCEATRYIHGDYAGIATNCIERENPGSVGLFLQGAQGDVNTCVAHKSEQESLLALDVIAARYARSVRAGLATAQPVDIASVDCALNEVSFTPKPLSAGDLRAMLADQEKVLHAPGASDESEQVRMAAVNAIALRRWVKKVEAGESIGKPAAIQGFRIGPIALLAAPFEIFQAIKNDVRSRAVSPIPLVMGITNGALGYAPDRTAAARGGYAADVVPLIIGSFPCQDIHAELVAALLDVERQIAASR